MYKMKVKKAYMKTPTECIDCPEGQIVDLPEDIAKAWLDHGFCEPAKKEAPKKETKIINPVEETKEAPKPKRKRTTKKAK